MKGGLKSFALAFMTILGFGSVGATDMKEPIMPSSFFIGDNQNNSIRKVVLPRNVVKGVNTLSQAMVNQANTIYVIQQDFVLGESITLPEDCELYFDGGSLRGGNIVGKNTRFNYTVGYNIFNDCNIYDFNIPYIDVRWFGAVSDYNIVTGKGTDCSVAFQRAFNQAKNCLGTYVYICGQFKIEKQVNVYGDFLLKGDNALSNNIFSHSFTDDVKKGGNSIIGVAHGITAFNIVGSERTTMSSYSKLKISIIDLEGFAAIEGSLGDYKRTSTFMKYSVTGAPSRPGRIEKVCVNGFDYAFKFSDDGKQSKICYYGTLNVNSVVAKFNNYAFYAKAITDNDITLSKINISNSELSDNSVEAIHIEGLYSPLFIHNTNLEGSTKILYVTTNNNISPTITISHCYSEGNQNNKALFEIHAKTNAYFVLEGNVIMNTNYDVVLDNTSFFEEKNYIDLNNRIVAKGNICFENFDYIRYCKNLDDVNKIRINTCDKRAYELSSGQYELRFHKSFDYKRMFSLLSNNEWGYKALVSNKGAVCNSTISVSKGDVVYVLLYTSLLNTRNILLVDNENKQNVISNSNSIHSGDGYYLLRFKCNKAASNMTPMLQSMGIGDQVGFAYVMINPTIEQLSKLRILSQKYFVATKDNMNVEKGKHAGITIFDSKRNCLTTWNGETWVDSKN